MTTLLQVIIYGIAVGAVYGLVALGFVLVFKTCGAFNVAQGELLMVLAFICMSLTTQFNLPFYLAVLITLVVAVILGFIIERLLLRPMVNQPLMAILMMTLGLALVIKSIALLVWSYHAYRFPVWLPKGELQLAGLALSWDYVASFLIVAVVLIAFALYFRYARFALAMRSVGEDQVVSQIMGIKISTVYGMAWALSLVVAAIGGIVLGTLTSVNSTLSIFGLFVIPVIIIGGLTSIPGAIVGGIIVGIAEKATAMYLGTALPGFASVIPYVLLLAILYIRPAGLWGEKVIERI
jgi:branched-chain amino acid transport system permease protein